VIVTKVLAGRPKDLDDVRALLALHGATMNTVLVETTLRLLQEALGKDLVPAFRGLTRSSRQGKVRRPKP
jgi:hypothetical protein